MSFAWLQTVIFAAQMFAFQSMPQNGLPVPSICLMFVTDMHENIELSVWTLASRTIKVAI